MSTTLQEKSRAPTTLLSNLRRYALSKNNNPRTEKETFQIIMNDDCMNFDNSRGPTLQKLKRRLESAETENRMLRSEKAQSIRLIREEMTRACQQKLAVSRQKMQAEKEKALQANTAHLRSCYEEKLEAVTKIKDKEIRSLESQLRKSQEKLYSSISRPNLNMKSQETNKIIKPGPCPTHHESRQICCQNPNSYATENPTAASRRQTLTETCSNSPINLGLPSSVELARQVGLLKEKLVSAVARERHTNAKLKQLEERYQSLSGSTAEAEKHIGSLLEELRSKEKKITEFEQSLRAIERRNQDDNKQAVTVVSIDSQNHSILQPEHQLEVGTEETEAKVSDMMSSLFGSAAKHKSHSGVQTISKEDHEKEKQRWQVKISEIEEQLRKAEEANGDYSQIKAELNKKVVELEKNQKPLIDTNKRLADKNKHLYQESKKMEEKVRHAQEDYLILKDSYDRLLSEYSKIKDKRFTPEKLDELDRFRQQNLEYCKCITALKQAAIEKDRKIELLNQKLRRIKKSRGYIEIDDDATSFISSECSVSSVSLDTITEDCEEIERVDLESNYRQLSKEHLELQRAFSTLKGASVSSYDYGEVKQREQQLQGQLSQVRTKASELEKSLTVANSLSTDTVWAQEKLSLTSRMLSLQTKVEELEKCKEDLSQELEECREHNELLEFRVHELEQVQEEGGITFVDSESVPVAASAIRAKTNAQSVCDRSVSTSDEEGFYSMDHSDNSSDEGVSRELSPEELKIRFTLLKHRRGLNSEDKAVVCRIKEWLEELQAQHALCQNKEMEWELKWRETEAYLLAEMEQLKSEQFVRNETLCPSVTESRSTQTDPIKQKESGSQDAEKLKFTDELSESEKQCEKLRVMLRLSQESEQKIREMEQKLRRQLSEIGESRRAEIEFMERNSRQHAESLAKLRDELEKVREAHDFLSEENQVLRERLNSDGASQLEAEKNRLLKDTVTAMKSAEESLTTKVEELEKKNTEAKERLREYVGIIREYEDTDKHIRDRLSEANGRVSQLEKEMEEILRRECGGGDDSGLRSELEEERKLVAQTRAYNQQLESQFQMQLQMVQILKEQLLQTQNILLEKTAECERRHNDSLLCNLLNTELCGMNLTGQENEEFFEAKRLQLLSAKPSVEGLDETSFVDGVLQLVSHCGLAAKKCHRLSVETEEARLSSSEAKERMEQLSRQHDDVVCQLGGLQEKQSMRERCVQTDPDIEIPYEKSYPDGEVLHPHNDMLGVTETLEGETILNRIVSQVRAAASTTELLQTLELEVSQILREYGVSSKFQRQFSPMEFSGTESEMCPGVQNQSPSAVSNSDGRSSSSASDPAPLSPGMKGRFSVSSGADGESSFSDSDGESTAHWRTKIHQRPPRGPRKHLSPPASTIVNIPESRRLGVAPTNLRLTSSLNGGTYFVLEWDCPANLSVVAGYNIYIDQAVYKTISDPTCAKVLLERTALAGVFQPTLNNSVHYGARMIYVGVATVFRPVGESSLSTLRITSELLRNLETFSNLQKSHLVVQLTREESCGPVGACLKDWSDV